MLPRPALRPVFDFLMIDLLAACLRWIFRHLTSFVVIVAILVGGKWFFQQLQAAEDRLARVGEIAAAKPRLEKALLDASVQVETDIRTAARESSHENGLIKRLLDQQRAGKVAEREAIARHQLVYGLPTAENFLRIAVLDMEIAALGKASEQATIIENLASDIVRGKAQWAALGEEHLQLRSRWARHALDKNDICAEYPIMCRIPGSPAYGEISRLSDEQATLKASADELRQRIENIKTAVELAQPRLDQANRAFGVGNADPDAVLRRAGETLAEADRRCRSDFFCAAAGDFWPAVRSELPTAGAILLTAMALPTLLKLFFYYLVAAWAGRRPPIRVITPATPIAASAPPIPPAGAKASSTSVPVEVRPGEELLVASGFIQSSSASSGKTTRWLLDWSFPLTSLATGLFALTRIAPQQAETIVISSKSDPLAEIAVLDLAADSSLVLRPHALVGVLQDRSRPLRITSHWRLACLHSWLTLQFRHLVFHGPAQLIVKGRRGVRIESAGNGRLISQAMTLGFTADAWYSVQRCETFTAYWRGNDELFNDRFDGAGGIYLYEELPAANRQRGLFGRGIEGLSDSVLKVFGL